MENTNWKKLVDNLTSQGTLRSPEVIKAILAVPRANFLPEDTRSYSAVDTPLSIGFGQTISAPHSLS